MHNKPRLGDRLFALFLIGVFLFNYPVLAMFSREGKIAGIPILYLFIFIAWAALIGLTAVLARRDDKS